MTDLPNSPYNMASMMDVLPAPDTPFRMIIPLIRDSLYSVKHLKFRIDTSMIVLITIMSIQYASILRDHYNL